MGGGKGGTTTSTVSIPPEVLARYNAVNARAEEAAKGSFQPYTGQFVAGLTPTQQAGISNTNVAAGLAQPFYQAATGYTQQGAQAVGPLTQGQIGYYQDPYLKSVVDPTRAAVQQQQGQERAALAARQASTGAFGGDRSGLERANLARQQSLGMAQAINPLYSQAYQAGVQTAAGQQGVIASDLQRRLAAGQQIAGLGTGAQAAALQGAQQQLAAGTAEQQTKQADLTAQYQQFLQQQGFPYQQAQFLANIAMGTGALSGSTTTTQAPTGFFSDRRLKHDVHEIGKTHDGQPIYSFKYNGDNKTQIGLMAQDVEKHHPEAVGVMGGYKTVDYGKATEDSERPERASGGVIPNSMGGGVWHPDAYAGGGLVDSDDMKAILQAQQAGFGPWGGGGVYGGAGQGTPGAKTQGVVPAASLPVPKLVTAGPAPARQQSGLAQAASTGSNLVGIGRAGVDFKNWVQSLGKESPKPTATTASPTASGPSKADLPSVSAKPAMSEGVGQGFRIPNPEQTVTPPDATPDLEGYFAQGGVIPHRYHRAGGGVNPYELSDDMSYIPKSVLKEGEEEADQAAGQFKKNTGQGGGSGSQGSGLGQAIGTASSLVNIGRGVGEFAKWLPTLFLAEGGVVPRQHFLDGGDAENYDPRADIPSENAIPVAVQRDPYDVLHPEFRDRMKAAVELANKEGIPVKLGSTVRSIEEQAALRAAKDAGTRGSYQGLPVAMPGHSAHNYALASDVSGLKPEQYGRFGEIVRGQGLTYGGDWKGSNYDPIHVQYGVGGFGQLKNAPRDEKGHIILPEGWASGKGIVPPADIPQRPVQVADASDQIGRQSTLGDVFSKITSDSIPSNENFWIPALAGVGSMLASTRPTFLGALGEGLVGGVSGYQTMQKQHAEMAKGVMDLIKDRFVTGTDKEGNTTFYDKVLGKFVDPSHVQTVGASMLSNLGINPKAYGFGSAELSPAGQTSPRTITSAPTAPTAPQVPSVTEGAPAPAPVPVDKVQAPPPAKAEAKPEDVNLYGKSESDLIDIAKKRPDLFPGLSGDRDPRRMQAEINQKYRLAEELSARGQPQQAALEKQSAKEQQDRLDKYLNEAVKFQYDQNTKLAEGEMKNINEYREGIKSRNELWDPSEMRLKRLADIAATMQTGNLAEAKAKLGGYLEQTGAIRLLPANVAESFRTATPMYDEAFKHAMSQALQSMAADKLIRAPKVGAEYELASVPNPSMAPGAVYALIGEKLGEMRWRRAMDEAYAQNAPKGTDPIAWGQNWMRKPENKLDNYVRDAFKDIPVPKGVGRAERESLQKSFNLPPESTPTPTVDEKPTAPQPSIPQALKNLEGLSFSPSRKQYRDKDGNIYDMNGKRVQ